MLVDPVASRVGREGFIRQPRYTCCCFERLYPGFVRIVFSNYVRLT